MSLSQTLEDRYRELATDRDNYLRRSRAYAAITVPSVCPPEGQSSAQPLPSNPTSFGARAAINLASKLLLSLMPPGQSAFELSVPIKTLLEEGVLSPPPEIVRGLAQTETIINAQIDKLLWRRPTFVTLLHLVVAGNICEYILPDGRIKQFTLGQYVCHRDWSGEILEIITADKMLVRGLPQELKQFASAKREDETVILYTRFSRVDDGSYTVQQDLDSQNISAEKEYKGIMPARALAWNVVPGEHYGRSHVEDNYEDLVGLNGVSQSIHESGALAARHLTFVRPNAAGGSLRRRVAEARNGAVLSGNPEDVVSYQFNQGNALAALREEKNDLKRDLAAAFLMTGDLRRDAERVTAYELRMLVQEIESALGGTYSLLSSELQAWRVRKLMSQMKARRELPQFADDQLGITVTTGIEALGRDERLNKVRSFLELLGAAGQTFAEDLNIYVKLDEVLTPGAVALGFPQAIRSDAEAQQIKERQQQQQAQQQLMGQIAGPMATAMAQNQGQPQ